MNPSNKYITINNMEKKVMIQPQSERAIKEKSFSAFKTYDDIKYWVKFVKNNSSLVSDYKTSECITIISDILDRLNDKIKYIEDDIENIVSVNILSE